MKWTERGLWYHAETGPCLTSVGNLSVYEPDGTCTNVVAIKISDSKAPQPHKDVSWLSYAEAEALRDLLRLALSSQEEDTHALE